MNTSKNKLLIIVLLIISAIYYIPIIKHPISSFDEGTILFGAERILKGQIPYKDFSTAYVPGQITLLAALFKVFGTSVTTERVYDLFVKSLLSLSIFFIIRFLSSSKYALFGWAMSLVWIAHNGNPGYPMYPFLLLIFVSVYFFFLHMKHNKTYYIILSAIFIVLSMWFRHDLGVLATPVFLIVLFLRRIMGIQTSWGPLILFISSMLAAGLPFLLYYVFSSSIESIYSELILNPLAFMNHRGFPYPSLTRNTLPFYVFPLVLLVGVISSLILMKRKTNYLVSFGMLLISIFGIVCLNQLRVRSDTFHLLPIALVSMILAPVLLYILPKLFSLSTQKSRVLHVLIIFVFCVTLYNPVKKILRVINQTKGYVLEVVNPDIERAKYSTILSDIKKVVPYIKKNTSTSDYIYVGVKNHDQFIFNDPVIYFLAERDCPTKYHELNPGVNNTLAIQQEMVSELKTRPAKMVILAPRWREEPNQSSIDQNIDLIDNYISANYELKEKIGLFEIWMKKI